MGLLTIESESWQDITKGVMVSGFWSKNNSLKTEQEVTKVNILSDVKYSCYVDIDCYVEEKDKVFVSIYSPGANMGSLIGCVRLITKTYEGFKICGLGKMAVAHEYRRNKVATRLLQVADYYMRLNKFDCSILWASVLKLYEKFGYMPIYKNMMFKSFSAIDRSKDFWIESIKVLGTW